MIHIVGLGPGNIDALTMGAVKLLGAYPLYLRTEKHPTVNYLMEEGIAFETFDFLYEEAEKFEDVYEGIKEKILALAGKEELVYAVPGHPLVAEKSVILIMEACRKAGIAYKIYPSVSFVDTMLEALEIDPISGLRIVDALTIEEETPDFSKGSIITQVFSPYMASRVKIALGQYLDDEDEIIYVRAAGTEEEVLRRIPLYELDRQKDVDDLTSVYVPPFKGRYDFYSFMRIVERLRDRDSGCPWDMEQTHESLRRYLIEESYEALEAVDLKDYDALAEELGDVLLQILLHATIGKEEGEFTVHDVIRAVSEKMIYRHPHVFNKEKELTADEVLVQWEELKKKEKSEESLSDSLSGISKYYPSLSRAEKIQKKARKYGFDWDEISFVFNKVEEEIEEIKEAMEEKDPEKVEKELGDLLFSVVNLSRFLEADPELSLNRTSDKFIRRIRRMEELLLAEGLTFKDLPLEELDKYWEIAKKDEKN
ncbi:nucleoside triphosphate pyrophosphohydrolase [Proteiniclasticum sp. C24MP]|uniref:nucleoside triphosphate pyrophosphohydrolase n=1 Tax=Proteiniclasticum sp. C24MP TaxID=3374101 RepID=UPI0037545B90